MDNKNEKQNVTINIRNLNLSLSDKDKLFDLINISDNLSEMQNNSNELYQKASHKLRDILEKPNTKKLMNEANKIFDEAGNTSKEIASNVINVCKAMHNTIKENITKETNDNIDKDTKEDINRDNKNKSRCFLDRTETRSIDNYIERFFAEFYGRFYRTDFKCKLSLDGYTFKQNDNSLEYYSKDKNVKATVVEFDYFSDNDCDYVYNYFRYLLSTSTVKIISPNSMEKSLNFEKYNRRDESISDISNKLITDIVNSGFYIIESYNDFYNISAMKVFNSYSCNYLVVHFELLDASDSDDLAKFLEALRIFNSDLDLAMENSR